MPHASGGGSRSSGYSGSSGGSSYHSSGGSRSSGYSSSSSRSSYSSSYSYGSSYSKPAKTKPRVSDTNFYGGFKYVYYRDNKPRYVYSNYSPVVDKPNYGRLVWFVPLLIMFIVGFYQLMTPPKRIDADYDRRIVVQDNIGVIDDEGELRDALRDFYNETGITGAVVTVYDSEWENYYAALENYAYEIYVNKFDDEYHWLMVYSEPESTSDGFVDWSWQGMAGDDTVSILTDEAADQFGLMLQKYLTASSRYSVGEAFTKAFREFTPEAMKPSYSEPRDKMIAVSVVVIYILIALACCGFFRRKPKKPAGLPDDAVICFMNDKEIRCTYCDGVYISNRLSCPYCGAPKP